MTYKSKESKRQTYCFGKLLTPLRITGGFDFFSQQQSLVIDEIFVLIHISCSLSSPETKFRTILKPVK